MSEPADQVFISYSRRDARLADRVAAGLTAAGFSVWIDRAAIRGGVLWRQQIVSAINDCRSFILLISPHSIQSDNVRKELDLAEQADRTVLPATLAQAEIPETLQYQLAGVQIIDMQADFSAGVGQLLAALGVEPSAAPQQPSGLLRGVLAGAGALALCAATLPLLRKAGLLEEKAGVAAGLAPQLPAWLWDAAPLSVIPVLAVLIAVVAIGKMRAGRTGQSRKTQSPAIALALYLLLVVPGTLILGEYVAAGAAILVAGGVWAAQARAGRHLLPQVAAVALTLVPVLPVIGDAFRIATRPIEAKATLDLPNPCVKAGDVNCRPPTAAPELTDDALQALAQQMRETISNVFRPVRAMLDSESPERQETGEQPPLLRLVNTVELHEGCAAGGEDRDRRRYSFLMTPQLRLQDGRVIPSSPPVAFSACRSEFRLKSLNAARELLERIQAMDRDPLADEVSQGQREFTEDEVMYIRRQIVLGWYVALKDLAIEKTYPTAEWPVQKGILDETIEKDRIEKVFPQVFASKSFADADFIWRGNEPEFDNEDVKRILDTFPSAEQTEVETDGRLALRTNLGSLTGTDN